MAMSQEHKDALARGRRESRAIKNYLKTIESRKPGRPVTKESLTSRLATVNSKLEGLDDPLKRSGSAPIATRYRGSTGLGEGRGESRSDRGGFRRKCEGVFAAKGHQLHGMAPIWRAGCGAEEGGDSRDPSPLVPTQLGEALVIDTDVMGDLVQHGPANLSLELFVVETHFQMGSPKDHDSVG